MILNQKNVADIPEKERDHLAGVELKFNLVFWGVPGRLKKEANGASGT